MTTASCSLATSRTDKTRPVRVREWLRPAAAGMLALAASACATMPAAGPTIDQLQKNAKAPASGQLGYQLVDLNLETVQKMPPAEHVGLLELGALSSVAASERADLIRKGDTLSIAIFEVGVSLFSGAASPSLGMADPTRAPTASSQAIAVQVREDGTVDLPYIGTVTAADTYPENLAAMIRSRLRQMSENPSVSVAIADSLTNVAYISGAVARSGRYRLTTAHERLLDIIAVAGGSPIDVNDLQVTLVRGDRKITAPLNQISAGDLANLPILPGDRISLERVRPTFTVFGATERVSQIPFDGRDVTLAEALARAGGPSDFRANPRGVYLFRLEKGADGRPQPTVYRLNMLRPETYFLAQSFAMRDKDTLLFANSSANLTQKLFTLLSQLFNPFVAVRAAAQ